MLQMFASLHVAAQSTYYLQVNSNGLNVKEQTLGHAFMIIKVHTSSGVKEEAFAFYSHPEATGVRDIPRLVIGTEGALQREFDHRPERFAKVDESVEIPISATQRKAIYQVVREWNNHHYELIDENCITFVNKTVERAGLPVPPRSSYVTANQYVRALRDEYSREVARREEERRRREEARRIPPGWVACNCPNKHAAFGKFVDGTLYHPDTLRCP